VRAARRWRIRQSRASPPSRVIGFRRQRRAAAREIIEGGGMASGNVAA